MQVKEILYLLHNLSFDMIYKVPVFQVAWTSVNAFSVYYVTTESQMKRWTLEARTGPGYRPQLSGTKANT